MTAAALVGEFRVGMTLHSFSHAFCAARWSFDDMMELTTRLGRGVEIVGPTHQRGFPHLTLEFERMFKSAVERYQLIPTAYGSYADPYMLPDRDLTPDELTEYTVLQLRAAARLGFPIVRLQYFTSTVIDRLLPLAERLNLRLGYELHAPLTFEADTTRRLIEQVTKLRSPHLGLIPDCGIFVRSIPAFRIQRARQAGAPERIVQRALALWENDALLQDAMLELTRMGLPVAAVGPIEMFWGSCGRSDPRRMLDVMAHIIHVHGKFFSMADGEEPDVRYGEVVETLTEGRYDGWLSSEYEGPHDVDAYHAVVAFQAMIQRKRDDAGARALIGREAGHRAARE